MTQFNSVDKIDIGRKVQFHANRITKGNPVKGVVKAVSDEWVELVLDHDIEGMVNIWYAGEEKSFRLSLIGAIKFL